MVKVELEVPDNVMKFLEAISGLTGKPAEKMLEEYVVGIVDHILSSWPDEGLFVTVEDLKKLYGV